MVTLTTSGACWAKAGANANLAIKGDEAQIIAWIEDAESWVSAETQIDWVDKFSGLSANFQAVLDDIVSSKVAGNMIQFDMSGFTSRFEAITMLNFNDNIVTQGIRNLKEAPTKTKMKAT